MNELDAYDVSKKIFELWQANANKSSGKINKGFLHTPIYVFVDNNYKKIAKIDYQTDIGIILTVENNNEQEEKE